MKVGMTLYVRYESGDDFVRLDMKVGMTLYG